MINSLKRYKYITYKIYKRGELIEPIITTTHYANIKRKILCNPSCI